MILSYILPAEHIPASDSGPRRLEPEPGAGAHEGSSGNAKMRAGATMRLRAGLVASWVVWLTRLRSPRALKVRKWQAHAELRTLPGSGASGTDGAVVKFDKMLGDVETHAYAGFGLSRGGQNKRVEEPG